MEDHLPVTHVVTVRGSKVLSSGEGTSISDLMADKTSPSESNFLILKSSHRFCLIVGADKLFRADLISLASFVPHLNMFHSA